MSSADVQLDAAAGPAPKRPPKTPRSLVSPPMAAVASVILPGLGQILAMQIQRGILMMAGTLSIAGIFVWRIAELGRRIDGFWESIQRAFSRRPLFVVFVLLTVALTWAFNAWDAWGAAKRPRRNRSIVFLPMLAAFFVLGWQVSEIDVGRAIAEFPDALPPLARVLWPWEAAIEYEQIVSSAAQEILIEGGGGDEPPRAERPQDGPYVYTEPRIGQLSEQNLRTLAQTPGTTLQIFGVGFDPDQAIDLWWIDEVGASFRVRMGGAFVRVMPDEDGSFETEIVMPFPTLQPDYEAGPVVHQLEARQVFQGAARASEALRLTISRMVETIIMGMMATFFGIMFSIPISFLAARNIMSGSRVTMAFYYLTRTILNIVRSIEPLIWALIAVVWVGLGPFAGIVALTLHSIAALGKLYSEAIESIDPGPIEAIQATGATRVQTIVFGVIPQMISPFISFSIYRWDINVRMSTVIGLVGGGGIGFILVQYIRLLDYRSAGIAVWFIAVTVAVLDYVSSEIRNRLM